MVDSSESWTLYILRCSDGTLYTGITNDLARRTQQHNLGLGARYTRGRGPVTLVYRERLPNRSEASKREYLIKQMTLPQKRQLIAQFEAQGPGLSGALLDGPG